MLNFPVEEEENIPPVLGAQVPFLEILILLLDTLNWLVGWNYILLGLAN